MNGWIGVRGAYVQPIDGRTIWCVEGHNYGWMLSIRYSDMESKLCGVYDSPDEAAHAALTVDLT